MAKYAMNFLVVRNLLSDSIHIQVNEMKEMIDAVFLNAWIASDSFAAFHNN